ncbi:hypothetical protein JTB14_026574 [Gonioctena quinquepunctata]|nr:hypothetical protein JTB14_026574 [Gonioctena quinquepunctata]
MIGWKGTENQEHKLYILLQLGVACELLLHLTIACTHKGENDIPREIRDSSTNRPYRGGEAEPDLICPAKECRDMQIVHDNTKRCENIQPCLGWWTMGVQIVLWCLWCIIVVGGLRNHNHDERIRVTVSARAGCSISAQPHRNICKQNRTLMTNEVGGLTQGRAEY